MPYSDELVFLPLGGSGEIGMNMNLYGFGPAGNREWIMVDCGVTFGDASTPGVDIICADPGYILGRKKFLKGILLTHGHEDHIGAVALLAPLLGCPVYATPFTAALVRRKLEEHGAGDVRLEVIDMNARFRAGPFDVSYVTLTHSIPEPCGIILRTPAGSVFHTGDWKIDPDPVLGDRMDTTAIKQSGDSGLLAMVCDSTNVLSAGESGSESGVFSALTELISSRKGCVVVAAFASNVARVTSICRAAAKAGRRICLLGRSMLRTVESARNTGIFPADIAFMEPEEASRIKREKVLYLCTGSQGEHRAALARIVRGEYRHVSLHAGDTVIFSSRIIPGNERQIYNLHNGLCDMSVEVVTEKDGDIHVSGHPCRDELVSMYGWARPEIAVPVHGEARHLEAHADLALQLGVPGVLAPRNGDLIRLAPDGPEVIEKVPAGRLYLDGTALVPSARFPGTKRHRLSYAGVCAISFGMDSHDDLDGDIGISFYGAPCDEAAPDMDGKVAALACQITDAFYTTAASSRKYDKRIENLVRQTVRRYCTGLWGKCPVIIVHIHRKPGKK